MTIIPLSRVYHAGGVRRYRPSGLIIIATRMACPLWTVSTRTSATRDKPKPRPRAMTMPRAPLCRLRFSWSEFHTPPQGQLLFGRHARKQQESHAVHGWPNLPNDIETRYFGTTMYHLPLPSATLVPSHRRTCNIRSSTPLLAHPYHVDLATLNVQPCEYRATCYPIRTARSSIRFFREGESEDTCGDGLHGETRYYDWLEGGA